ncbi:DUF397 domain-containing protein [Sphaerisporangium sp. NPDC088356]|uniref:DUF397 domain-containing protein n=1 Tax=Sphaerisporangium sp. NPDC088356 TaxID=3154871 RepID=UPI0034397DA1
MNDPKPDLYAHDLSTAQWRKSSASAAENDCVEITNLPNGAKAVRDSKNPDIEPLRLNDSGWAAFRQGILHGLTP